MRKKKWSLLLWFRSLHVAYKCHLCTHANRLTEKRIIFRLWPVMSAVEFVHLFFPLCIFSHFHSHAIRLRCCCCCCSRVVGKYDWFEKSMGKGRRQSWLFLFPCHKLFNEQFNSNVIFSLPSLPPSHSAFWSVVDVVESTTAKKQTSMFVYTLYLFFPLFRMCVCLLPNEIEGKANKYVSFAAELQSHTHTDTPIHTSFEQN